MKMNWVFLLGCNARKDIETSSFFLLWMWCLTWIFCSGCHARKQTVQRRDGTIRSPWGGIAIVLARFETLSCLRGSKACLGYVSSVVVYTILSASYLVFFSFVLFQRWGDMSKIEGFYPVSPSSFECVIALWFAGRALVRVIWSNHPFWWIRLSCSVGGNEKRRRKNQLHSCWTWFSSSEYSRCGPSRAWSAWTNWLPKVCSFSFLPKSRRDELFDIRVHGCTILFDHNVECDSNPIIPFQETRHSNLFMESIENHFTFLYTSFVCQTWMLLNLSDNRVKISSTDIRRWIVEKKIEQKSMIMEEQK